MKKMTELILGFYGTHGETVIKETIALEVAHYGVGELTVRYPHGSDRRIPLEQIGIPRTRVKESRSDMFIEGEATDEHTKMCVDAYSEAIAQEITKVTEHLDCLRKEAKIWKYENVKYDA